MHQAKILGRKRVADLMRPGVEGMTFQARLHPDRLDLLPKMLLGIAEDVLRHGVCQGVIRLIVDRNVRQLRGSFTIMHSGSGAAVSWGISLGDRDMRHPCFMHSMPKALARRVHFCEA